MACPSTGSSAWTSAATVRTAACRGECRGRYRRLGAMLAPLPSHGGRCPGRDRRVVAYHPYVVGGHAMARELSVLLTAALHYLQSRRRPWRRGICARGGCGAGVRDGRPGEGGHGTEADAQHASTAVMIRLGRVGNRMVIMQLTNDNLWAAARAWWPRGFGAFRGAQARALLPQYRSVKKALEHAPKPE